jgi:hypothetical protein
MAMTEFLWLFSQAPSGTSTRGLGGQCGSLHTFTERSLHPAHSLPVTRCHRHSEQQLLDAGQRSFACSGLFLFVAEPWKIRSV